MNSISFQSVYNTITARGEFKLGQRAMTPDGREWQFIKANTAIANSLIAIPDQVTAVTDVLSSGVDNQNRIVYITDNSAFTTGQFEDAIGIVSSGTGIGQTFKIRTNSPTVVTLYPETALTTALDTTSDLIIRTMSECDPAAITSKLQMAQGAPQVSFAAGDYGWILTNGAGRAVAGNTLVVGAGFTTGDDTVGNVIVSVVTEGPLTAQNLGFAIAANTSADTGALVRYIVR